MKKLLSTLSLLLLTLSTIHCMDLQQAEEYSAKKKEHKHSSLNIVGQIGAGLALSYVNTFATTFFHEMGHAVAAKLLFNNPITVGLGAAATAAPAPGINLYGLNPFRGFCHCTDIPIFTKAAALQALAGPVAGILHGIACNYILKKQTILPPITTAMCRLANAYAISTNIAQLDPTSLHWDGGKVALHLRALKYRLSNKNFSADLPFFAGTTIQLAVFGCATAPFIFISESTLDSF